MSSLRDVVSRVRSTNKFVNSADNINDRVIAAELKSKAILLIKREAALRKLWATDTIFTTVPCLPMKKVSLSECCDYRSDRSVSRSINKLPRVSEGIYGYLIKGVYDLDSSIVITYMNPNRYINRLKLNLFTNEAYYWITDGYIYITNPSVKSIRISAFLEDDLDFSISNPKDCDCTNSNQEKCPPNPLDLDFKCPGYLEGQVVEMTSQYLKRYYLGVDDIKTEANQDTQRSH